MCRTRHTKEDAIRGNMATHDVVSGNSMMHKARRYHHHKALPGRLSLRWLAQQQCPDGSCDSECHDIAVRNQPACQQRRIHPWPATTSSTAVQTCILQGDKLIQTLTLRQLHIMQVSGIVGKGTKTFCTAPQIAYRPFRWWHQ